MYEKLENHLLLQKNHMHLPFGSTFFEIKVFFLQSKVNFLDRIFQQQDKAIYVKFEQSFLTAACIMMVLA